MSSRSGVNGRFLPERLRRLLAEVESVVHTAQAGATTWTQQLAAVPLERRPSARNLAQYLAVRSLDLRPLQGELARCSLSSLGRMEASVMDTLIGLREVLAALSGGKVAALPDPEMDMAAAEHLLDVHTAELLGSHRPGRRVLIMVTLPLEAAHDEPLMRSLLLAGMDVARLNLAHGDLAIWSGMVEKLRAASTASGIPCRIMVDLPGPKLRTGALEPGPQVLRVRPVRDPLGVVTQPATVAFVDPDASGHDALDQVAVVPILDPLAGRAEPGDEIVLRDTRGRRRRFSVLTAAGGVIRTAVARTAYLATGCRLELRREGKRIASTRVGELPALEIAIPLAAGDRLVVTRDDTPGGLLAHAGETGAIARVPCTLPEVFAGVMAGHRVLFDDGRIAGVVEASGFDGLLVRITEVPPGGGKLKAEKGINLPDSELPIGALTEFDRSCLDWLAEHADVVGMSFVQRPADVLDLHKELAQRSRSDLGVVLKIETKQAFERLPELLFAGLQRPPLGVMVARGDLAVEVGFARLAEVQEEILWLCEAAHVPVIWATQVLDSMARTGVPSRAEVTDASTAVQAECVMLNKGPHIVETTEFLAGVLERMSDHHRKKRSMMRRLRVAGEVSSRSAEAEHGAPGG